VNLTLLPAKTTWAHMAPRIRHPKTISALNLRSHSIDKLNHYDRRIVIF
jgi:hypothetical protein